MPAEHRTPDTDAASDGETERESPSASVAPSDAFQALGGETRIAILRALATAEPCAFSELFEATGEDTSAGFAYHLRQLDDRFVRQREDERYELTDAGRRIVRDVRAGTFTDSVDRDPVELAAACPFCEEQALVATVVDNVTEVGCRDCNRSLLSTSVPPGGYADRTGDRLPAAVDARYRRRIDSFADGVCPECAGTVRGTVEPAGETGSDERGYGDSGDGSHDDGSHGDGDDGDGDTGHSDSDTGHGGHGDTGEAESDDHRAVQATYACDTCEATLRCPVTLTLLTHPAVVAFYHDHGEDIRDRPVWNVGSEWAECLLSRDPWCVGVQSRLDDEILSLYVARDGSVVDYRRCTLAEEEAVAGEGTDDEHDPDDDPDGGSRPPASADSSGERAVADSDAPTADDPEVTDPSASADGATA